MTFENNCEFHSVSEQPENLNYNKLAACPHCQKPIPIDSISCLYCGQTVNFSRKPSWFFWAAILLLISLAAFFIF